MTIFWHCEGVLLVDFLPRGTTINGLYYVSLLHRLRFSIQEKRQAKLKRGILLLHNNTPVHKFIIIQATIQYTSFTELNHSAYSPDIAASNYHLFSNLKNFLHSRNLESDDEAMMTVNPYFQSVDCDSFSRRMES